MCLGPQMNDLQLISCPEPGAVLSGMCLLCPSPASSPMLHAFRPDVLQASPQVGSMPVSLTSFQNSIPGMAVATVCPEPHCTIMESRTASLREVGAPLVLLLLSVPLSPSHLCHSSPGNCTRRCAEVGGMMLYMCSPGHGVSTGLEHRELHTLHEMQFIWG